MTGLLVSVRNADEAETALAGGADLIDVKEPDAGPLGAASPDTIDAVIRQVAGRAPVSAALGELTQERSLAERFRGRLAFAKFGLSGCAQLPDWKARWARAVELLPWGVTAVAVLYADWQSAQAPSPARILALAPAIGCGAVLVDTFDKSRGSLAHHWSLDELASVAAKVRRADLLWVIAGGLGLAEIGDLLPLAPDYLAVRGAACVGNRAGTIDLERVRQLSRLIKRQTALA